MSGITALLAYALLAIGGFCAVVGAIGLIRFPNYFVRLHAATVAVIGGSVVPLVGLAIYSLSTPAEWDVRAIYFSNALIIAALIVLTSPVGTHAMARAAHRAGVPVEPKVCDKLEEALR
ncbi:MAG: monovalent cation/H(+) antiporter subunit G [Candidatus Bathyarchaeia archaeon]